ncbi:MAG: efflux RND transporter periplasmic adaptor subunit [Phycisphaeraceae bacterium]
MESTTQNNNRWWFTGGAIVIALMLIGVVLAVTGAAGDASSRSGDSDDWFDVRIQPLDLTVVATGELESQERIEIRNLVNGRPAITFIVDEGTRAVEGDILVKLDDREIRDRLESQELDVESARLDLTTADRELEIQRNEADSARKDAEVKLATAKLDIEKWRQGDVVQKQRDLQLALDKAERNVIRAARDLELSVQLFEEKFISENEKDDDEIAEIEAREALESAKLAIEIYENFEFVKQQQEKQTAVEQAEAELERVIAKNEARMARYESDVRSKQRTLELREQGLAETRDQLEKTVIKAPAPGLVVYASSVGDSWRRGDPMAVGREVRNNETIIFLPDINRMTAVLKVHEALLPQVKIGQKAVVNIDARPNSPVDGEVSVIGVTADSGGWLNPDLREYKVRINLPEGFDASLKPAMRLSGEIFTGRIDDALTVPIQAVHAEGGGYHVYTPTGDGRVEATPVSIGQANDTMVQIVEGIEEGQRVLLRTPRASELVERQIEVAAAEAAE